jgi:hypothetical protein
MRLTNTVAATQHSDVKDWLRMPDPGFDPMAMMEQVAQSVAALTGIKQQLIDAGWNEHNAEKLTIQMLASAQGTNRT